MSLYSSCSLLLILFSSSSSHFHHILLFFSSHSLHALPFISSYFPPFSSLFQFKYCFYPLNSSHSLSIQFNSFLRSSHMTSLDSSVHQSLSLLLPLLGQGDNPENTKPPYHPFFSQPSLQTALDKRIMENNGWPLASRSWSPGRESTQRLCTCFG